jgi:hypothetical protein
MNPQDPADLTKLDISAAGAAEKVLFACQLRLAEHPEQDCVHLFFQSGDNELVIEKMDTVASVSKKIGALQSPAR